MSYDIIPDKFENSRTRRAEERSRQDTTILHTGKSRVEDESSLQDTKVLSRSKGVSTELLSTRACELGVDIEFIPYYVVLTIDGEVEKYSSRKKAYQRLWQYGKSRE